MPRPTRTPAPTGLDAIPPVPPAPLQPNTVIASAARISTRQTRAQPASSATGWQSEAWEMLDAVGELEFYREWVANAMSRVTLYVEVEEVNAEGEVTTRRLDDPNHLAVRALDALFDGEAGQSQMLSAMGSHLSIPGESWLVGLIDPPPVANAPDRWRVLSKDEVKQQAGQFVIDRGDGQEEKYDDGSNPDRPAQALVIRVWQPHPRKYVHATSSVRSALPILRLLVGLSRYIGSSVDSRLAGAGLLVVPSEMSFTSPLPPVEGGAAQAVGDVNQLVAELTYAASQALSDPSSPAARVPIMVQAPGSVLEHIKHLTFDTPFGDRVIELVEKMIQRLAASLDVPAEVLTGMADVNHWTGWLLDENAIKMHIEPKAEVIVHAINTSYLWPVMQGDDPLFDPGLRAIRVKSDTSALRQRPNRAAEAKDLHADLLITDEARARESGFTGGDLLVVGSDEYARRLRQKIAGGVTTADLTAAALDRLGAGLTPVPSEVADPAAATPGLPGAPEPAALPTAPAADTPAAGTPSTGQTPPALTASADVARARFAAVLITAELASMRAIERGWSRARGGRVRKPVAAHLLDTALADAWSDLDRPCALAGVDVAAVTDTLDHYVRAVLTTGAAHDPFALRRLVHERVLTDPDAAA